MLRFFFLFILFYSIHTAQTHKLYCEILIKNGNETILKNNTEVILKEIAENVAYEFNTNFRDVYINKKYNFWPKSNSIVIETWIKNLIVEHADYLLKTYETVLKAPSLFDKNETFIAIYTFQIY